MCIGLENTPEFEHVFPFSCHTPYLDALSHHEMSVRSFNLSSYKRQPRVCICVCVNRRTGMVGNGRIIRIVRARVTVEAVIQEEVEMGRER